MPFYIPDISNTIKIGDELLTTNAHGGRKLYISKIDNAFYAADKRWNIETKIYNGDSLVSSPDSGKLFDGTYDNYININAGYKAIIKLDFSNTTEGYLDLAYPYGDIIVSFYDTYNPQSISMRAYCNYQPHGIGWKDLNVVYLNNSTSGAVLKARNGWYKISQIEITINAKSDSAAWVSEIEFNPDRAYSNQSPFVSKYVAETLYYPLTAPSFKGDLDGKLKTKRTIALGTAVSSTATGFDGSANITIPVNSVNEAYLAWGGKDFSGGFGPLDAALIGDLSINRLAGLPDNKWKFERSSDAGATWTEYTGPKGSQIGTIIKADSIVGASNANTTSSKSVNN